MEVVELKKDLYKCDGSFGGPVVDDEIKMLVKSDALSGFYCTLIRGLSVNE